MSSKYYCLKCQAPNSGCKCGNTDYHFSYSYKLRVPTSIKNKVLFRKFLDDCPIFVNCVPEELKPAFRDLLRKVKYFDKSKVICLDINISNFKYSSKNSDVIIFSYIKQKHVIVSINNQGNIISAKDIEKIKDPFVRVNKDSSIQGFGLGLAIANKIVLAHNGKLEIVSNINDGRNK